MVWADLRGCTYSFMSSTDESGVLNILHEKKDRDKWETSFKALAQPFFQVHLCVPACRCGVHGQTHQLTLKERGFFPSFLNWDLVPVGSLALVLQRAGFWDAASDPLWEAAAFLPFEKITSGFLSGEFCSCSFVG